ncbi:uncharacterized protein LOC128680887 isoform X2 [Plodia interpunctella]|nr:uncharacterized protein LOC128680887 isoform X2 [Plodia interpunctella]
MYLIEMIHAKKFKSEEELNAIIKKVKRERQQASQGKKKVARKQTFLQGTEISSTSNSLSPPISMTPKRAGHIVIRCSPENIREAIAKYNARQHLTRSSTAVRKTYSSPKKSDRVLRSFNIKTNNDTKIIENKKSTLISSNVATFANNNSVFSVLRPENVKESQEQRFPKMIAENCMVKRYKPVLNRHPFGLDPERSQLIPVTRNVGTNPMVPAKRQRVLSGIYPIIPKEPPKITYEIIQSVGFRRQDGKISKINAVVQKRSEIPQIQVTVQDIINKSITQTLSNPYVNTETGTNLTYSNINAQDVDALKTEMLRSNVDEKNEICNNIDQRNDKYGMVDRNEGHSNIDNRNDRYGNSDQRNERYDSNMEGTECPYSVYYHKKIRGEQVRSQRSYQREVSREEERLPTIDSVFSRFNAHTDVTQPIYVQVSDESEKFQSHPLHSSLTSTTPLLEQLYNFRSGFLVNQPLLSVATTTATNCVYSTPVIATAVPQPSLAPDYTSAACERDNYYSDLAGFPRICELLKFGEQENIHRNFRCDEELSTSSSLDDAAPQELGATVTIPEMVEDALELISQDGDYMERIGMDVRMQCLLCTFVCPKFLLEYHIRKEHSNLIHHQEHNSWTMSFPLGSLLKSNSVTVLSHDAALFVLSVNYHIDCLYTTVHSLVTDTNLPKNGSITIYNKVTGEPHTWEGEIQTLPHDFAYNNTDGLKVEVSKLDLLPNSANLKLLNGNLVLKSPTNVVIGQPDLNDIHVILFVKIND